MKVELLKVFVASPGDVSEERRVVREVIEDLNRSVASEKNVTLQVVGWETDARPGFGGDPQSLVNAQIADMSQYDLFIGVLWDRFGTPTPRAESGTEEEFDRAVEEHRQGRRPGDHVLLLPAPLGIQVARAGRPEGEGLGIPVQTSAAGLDLGIPGHRRISPAAQHAPFIVAAETGERPPLPPPEP